MKRAVCLAIYGLFAVLPLSNQAHAEIAIIINSSQSLDSLSNEEVSNIYLNKKVMLPNGQHVVPVSQPRDKTVTTEFNDKVLHKTDKQLDAYWGRLLFSGNGQPPKVVGDDEAVKELVAHNPNIMGYIKPGNVDASVKVILRIK